MDYKNTNGKCLPHFPSADFSEKTKKKTHRTYYLMIHGNHLHDGEHRRIEIIKEEK